MNSEISFSRKLISLCLISGILFYFCQSKLASAGEPEVLQNQSIADAYFHSKDYVNASTYYQEALNSFGSDEPASGTNLFQLKNRILESLGLSLVSQQDWAKSKEIFLSLLHRLKDQMAVEEMEGHTGSISAKATLANVALNLALSCQEMGQQKKAVKFYLKALEAKGEDAEYFISGGARTNSLFNLGRAAFGSGNFWVALTAFHEAISDPSRDSSIYGSAFTARARSYIGAAYIKLGPDYYQQAKVYFLNALRVAKTDLDQAEFALVYYNLAFVLYEQKDYAKAAFYSGQALAVDSEGESLLPAEVLEDAKKLFKKANKAHKAKLSKEAKEEERALLERSNRILTKSKAADDLMTIQERIDHSQRCSLRQIEKNVQIMDQE